MKPRIVLETRFLSFRVGVDGVPEPGQPIPKPSYRIVRLSARMSPKLAWPCRIIDETAWYPSVNAAWAAFCAFQL